MRFITSLCGAIVALIAASPSLSAQEVAHRSALDLMVAPAATTTRQVDVKPLLVTTNAASSATPQHNCELQAAETSTAKSVRSSARAKAKAPSSVSDIAGAYVQTYKTLISSGVDGGNSVLIKAVEGSSNQVTISGWGGYSSEITATVDFTAKTVTIPSQYLTTNATYGTVDLAVCTSTGAPDRTQSIVGTINDDGTISISTWWGIYVNEGDYADRYFYLGYSTELEPSNATMDISVKSTDSEGNVAYKDYNYYVIAEQTAKNILTVKNFAGLGHTVELILNRDSTATIESQVVRNDATYGEWYSIGGLTFNDSGYLSGYTKTITTDKATNSRNITWGNWSWLCSSYYAGVISASTITTSFDISYPSLSVTDFEGKGTADEPYLISSADGLILLSDKVKEVSEYTSSTGVNGSKYARIYKDVYFKITNDIDLDGTRFTPIGSDWQHVFAGTIDGDNHTIKGLNVSASGTYGFGGLIGHADTLSVIKNIIVDSPVISGSYCTGGVVGWTNGTVENCHVNNPTLTNTGVATGGIAGIARIMTNCSVSGGKITGTGGYSAGVAGQIGRVKYDTVIYESYIENCYAEEVKVVCGAAADGYPSGGVLGTLYYATAKNCWFKGVVDGASLRVSNQVLGGVTGTAMGSSIDQCFSVGSVSGYDSKAQLGGVAGACIASTITNSYAAGRVDASASRYAGGLIGYLRAYTIDGVLTQSTVENCYTSTQTTAETYQYDRTSEYREIFGTIESDTEPSIKNAYFDQNVNDKTSLKYGATTDFLTAEGGISGFDSSIWTFTKGQYPRLTKFADTEAALYSASAILTTGSSSLKALFDDATLAPLGTTVYSFYNNGFSCIGHYATIDGNKLQINSVGTDTLYVINGSTGYYLFVKSSPIAYKGSGSEADPYLLQTKEDLVTLSQSTTIGGQLFQGIYFKLANDIDLEYDEDFIGICADETDAHGKFAGTIDGDGHTIHRMDIVHAAWDLTITPDSLGVITITTSYGNGWKGFVGRLDPIGTVKNLNIAADCNLNGVFATTGAIVGYNEGLIENCKNYADIMGYSCWIGGIAGQNILGTIRNCYNEGNISSGYYNVGGICGTSSGIVEGCANAGNVTCKQIASNFPSKVTSSSFNCVGGITGTLSSSIVRNCLNTGTVTGNTQVGGISATLPKASTSTTRIGDNDVYNCINYGAVWSNDAANTGAIAGTFLTQGTIANNYYDAQIVTWPAAGNVSVDGIAPVETSVLTSGTALESYDAETWQFDAGQYPVIKKFASEAKLANARKTIVSIPTGVTATDLSANATLAVADSLTWSLVNGTVFTISDNTLVAPASVSDVVADTLVANYGSYNKTILVQRTPSVPLSGAGTEADPYTISSVAEWNSFANYIETAGYTFEGEFVKLTSDIDFGKAEITKAACDGANKFLGTFDGNGKTLSNYTINTTANYQGLFGIIGAEGTVKNLTIAGDVTTAYTFTGGLAGKLYGKLIGCVNTGSVTTTKASTAGLVGQAYNGAELTDCVNKGAVTRTGSATYTAGVVANTEAGVTFTRCGNEGEISNTTAGTYTAGVVAYALPSTFIDCYNTGDVSNTGTTTAATHVAGIIAYANGAAGSDPYTISGCYNKGDITATGPVAGIVATCGTTAGNAKLNIDNCYNEGDIVSNSSKAVASAPVAGIVGKYSAGSNITNCHNSGTLVNTYNVYTAGIAGYYAVAGTAAYPIVISNCYNDGNIVATGNQGAGIIAYEGAYVTVDSCYNVGTIEGGWGLGGVAACLGNVNSTVNNSWNAGKVTGSSNRVGGIVAYNTVAAAINNCWNIGDISTTLTTQGTSSTTSAPSGYGIGGIAGTSGSVLTNCYNVGTVTGASQVGGIVGQTTKAKTQLVSCYNAGRIVAAADTCGALVGVKYVDNPTRWTDGNEIKDCYYVTDYNTFDNEQLGTAVKIADLAKLDLGSAWTSADNYSYPVLAGQTKNPGALAGSAAVVLSGSDTYDNVTSTVYVGMPEGVEWTSSLSTFAVSGNEASFGTISSETPITLTVTAGEVSRSWTLTLKVATGISNLNAGNKAVVNEVYYDLSGRVVPKPISTDGQLYIVKITYDDNTIEVAKVINN